MINKTSNLLLLLICTSLLLKKDKHKVINLYQEALKKPFLQPISHALSRHVVGAFDTFYCYKSLKDCPIVFVNHQLLILSKVS